MDAYASSYLSICSEIRIDCVFLIEFLGKKASLGAILEDPCIPKILGF
jgi:hypothetical protein